VPTCVAGDVETVATEGAIPSEAAATVTECSGSDPDRCECDWDNQESVGWINGDPKCFKCPDGMRPLESSVPTCYSCPTGQINVRTIDGPKCFDECAAGAWPFPRPKLVPSIVTSDKLRCFKDPTPAQTTASGSGSGLAPVAPGDSKFFVTM